MSKVIVIGLDGATFELIEPWVESGKLPTFAKLMQEGSRAPLESTIPPLTVPAWATMFTGKNPGKLGLFGLASRNSGEYSIGGPPLSWDDLFSLWDIVERFDEEACVMSVPTTSVPEGESGGPFVAGTGPMIGKSDDRLARPVSLEEWLNEIGYPLHLRPSNASRKSPEGKRKYLEQLEELTESRFRVGNRLIEQENWELFVFSLFHTDMTQHIFWRDFLEGGEFQTAILDYYRVIDEKLGELLEKNSDPANVLIVSDHGHTRLAREIDLNRLLVDNGWMKMKSEEKHKVTKRGIAELLSNLGLKKAYRKVRQLPLFSEIDSRLRDEVPLDEHSSEDVNWSETYAYSFSLGGIYLNVSGREPRGIVEEGEEYDRVREEIMEAVRNLKDPDSGELVVNGVFKKEEKYEGPYLDRAPDILIDYKDRYQDSHSEPAPQHENIFNQPSSFFTSTHTKDGVFIASGPDVREGGRLEGLNKPISLLDITPTVLHLLGLPIPNDVDGKVRKEIFTEDSEPNIRTPDYFQAPDKGKSERGLTDEENREVKQRLEDLGYL